MEEWNQKKFKQYSLAFKDMDLAETSMCYGKAMEFIDQKNYQYSQTSNLANVDISGKIKEDSN